MAATAPAPPPASDADVKALIDTLENDKSRAELLGRLKALEVVEPSSGQRFGAADLCISSPSDAEAKAAASVSVELPLTQTLRRLEAAGRPVGDVLTVQLVPVALGATPGQVEIEPEAIEVEFS